MSCNYADGLSPYENKGLLGLPEKFDKPSIIHEKCSKLAKWIKESKHVVVHTGAGISTAAGIPDFRGPNGVWTLEKQGKKPNINISFDASMPTKTHMALKKLIESGYVHYIISQNIDGLHLRTGLERKHIAELHGNMFIEQCNVCESQFVRSSATTSVGKKSLNADCRRSALKRRACRGKMHDTILDWEHNLPEDDLEMSDYHSSIADLNICLGTTLQIVPSGNLPLKCKKFGGKIVIVNLQPTKHDKKADLIINTYIDDVLERLMKDLNLEIPEYSEAIDPTKNLTSDTLVSWNIPSQVIKDMKTLYEKKTQEHKKRKTNQIGSTKKKLLKKEDMKFEKLIKMKQELGSPGAKDGLKKVITKIENNEATIKQPPKDEPVEVNQENESIKKVEIKCEEKVKEENTNGVELKSECQTKEANDDIDKNIGQEITDSNVANSNNNDKNEPSLPHENVPSAEV